VVKSRLHHGRNSWPKRNAKKDLVPTAGSLVQTKFCEKVSTGRASCNSLSHPRQSSGGSGRQGVQTFDHSGSLRKKSETRNVADVTGTKKGEEVLDFRASDGDEETLKTKTV